MDIILNTQTLLSHIKEEVSHVADRAYAGDGGSLYDAVVITSRDEDIVKTYITNAAMQLSRRCRRFLQDEIIPTYDNDRVWPDSYIYHFAFGERRALNKAEPLTAVMHDFVVQYALSKWYAMVNQGELSNRYSLEALESGRQIDEMLYNKQPPRV